MDKLKEFDYKALYEAYGSLDLSDKNTYGICEAGARWQFNRLQAELKEYPVTVRNLELQIEFVKLEHRRTIEFQQKIIGEMNKTNSENFWIIRNLESENATLKRERDLALAHDTQPYPTAWAYEQACKTIDELKERLAKFETLDPVHAAVWKTIEAETEKGKK